MRNNCYKKIPHLRLTISHFGHCSSIKISLLCLFLNSPLWLCGECEGSFSTYISGLIAAEHKNHVAHISVQGRQNQLSSERGPNRLPASGQTYHLEIQQGVNLFVVCYSKRTAQGLV